MLLAGCVDVGYSLLEHKRKQHSKGCESLGGTCRSSRDSTALRVAPRIPTSQGQFLPRSILLRLPYVGVGVRALWLAAFSFARLLGFARME